MFLNNNDKTRVFGSEIYTKYMNISATLIEQEKWAPKDSTDILLAFARSRTISTPNGGCPERILVNRYLEMLVIEAHEERGAHSAAIISGSIIMSSFFSSSFFSSSFFSSSGSFFSSSSGLLSLVL